MAQKAAMHLILMYPFFEKHEVSQVDVKGKQAECIANMKEVNDLNWQVHLKANKAKKGEKEIAKDKAMPDYESIDIGIQLRQIINDPRA